MSDTNTTLPDHITAHDALPEGEPISSHRTYQSAQQTVRLFAAHGLPLHTTSIVGNNLKTVEHVTGKLSSANVALSGAITGGILGLLVGFALSFAQMAGSNTLIVMLAGILIGAGAGVFVNVLLYSLNPNRRTYQSHQHTVAASYDVYVEGEHRAAARALLQEHRGGTTS